MTGLSWLTDPSAKYPQLREALVRLVDDELERNISSPDELRTIYLFLTRKCNLGCQHCYIEGVGPKAKGVDFNLDTIRGLIEQALPYGLRKVKVSGGEPMVHKEFMAIMEYLDACGLKELVLETNGTLFKEDTIERLSRISNLTIFVSLDHMDHLAHDEFRGKPGAFNITTSVLKALGKTDIDTVVTTTANVTNYRHVNKIIDLVLSWGIGRHRTLLNIHPVGNARGHPDKRLTLEECETLIGELLKSPHFASGRAYMTLPPALMPPHFLRGIHTCGWGDSVLGILSTGEISMCSASYDDEEMIADNALSKPLINIWRDSSFFKELRDVAAGNVKGVCGNCIFYKACRGVCKMSSWAHYGEKDAPYPLCQEVYNTGRFPLYALVDPDRDCTYEPGAIRPRRMAKLQPTTS